MRRLALLLLAAATCLPGTILAQQDAEPTHLYVARYKVNYGDLEEWNRLFNEHAVPILTEMQSEGIITNWGNWQHDTGGDYANRFTV